MPNTYAQIADKKIVDGDGVKKLRKETLELVKTAVEAIEEAISEKVGGNGRIYYGTCSTEASTQGKTATIDGLESIKAGDIFIILMTSGQTYNGAPTMEINDTGAAGIRRLTGTNAGRYEWVAGQVIPLFYNGSHFIIMDGGIASTTYYGKTKLSSEVDSESESVAATPKAVKAAYDLAREANSRTVDLLGLCIVDGYLCQKIGEEE